MRLLHTMIRVFDLDASLNFYQNILGMQLLRKNDYTDGRFTLAFLGYGDESENTVIELTHNWDQKEPYEQGTAFGHLAIEADDIFGVCEGIRQKGGQIIREPGPMKFGNTIIAFVADPDGYKIELIQKGTQ